MEGICVPENVSNSEAGWAESFVAKINCSADLNSVSEDVEKEKGGKKATLSCLVGKTGFELTLLRKSRRSIYDVS